MWIIVKEGVGWSAKPKYRMNQPKTILLETISQSQRLTAGFGWYHGFDVDDASV
jgi:hypothetical protein